MKFKLLLLVLFIFQGTNCFFARGFYILGPQVLVTFNYRRYGQRVYIIPSKKLVVVRMGYSMSNFSMNDFLREVITTLPG